jgi:hypothetical protein
VSIFDGLAWKTTVLILLSGCYCAYSSWRYLFQTETELRRLRTMREHLKMRTLRLDRSKWAYRGENFARWILRIEGAYGLLMVSVIHLDRNR